MTDAEHSSPSVPTVRVAALLIQDGAVLTVRQNKDGRELWMLPGGKLSFGETLSDALRREIDEELDLPLEVERPLAFVESISPDLADYPEHMLHVVMLCRTERRLDPAAVEIHDENTREIRLVRPQDMAALGLRPAISEFLAECVRALPDGVRYLGVAW